MGEVQTTIYELYVQRLLKYLDIPFLTNHVLCFDCGAHFYHPSSAKPTCAVGLHDMTTGSFCRPDVIIEDKRAPMPVQTHTEEFVAPRFSILRIDGEIHEKKRVIKRDRAQERDLNRLNIPFFVSDNDFWKWDGRGRFGSDKKVAPDPYRLDYKKIPRQHLDYLLSIFAQTQNSDLYKKYGVLKEISDSKF